MATPSPSVIERTQTSSVKGRLIEAADAEITESGLDNLQMDVVARRAGVSRATAFRQLGSITEVVIQVALVRCDRHRETLRRLMDARVGVFTKIEAAMLFSARELPNDPALHVLISRHSGSAHDPRVRSRAMDVLGQVLHDGQHGGDVRTDLELDELVDFVVEQTYLAAEAHDRSEEAVRQRFRRFVIPALSARETCSGEYRSRIAQVEATVASTRDALDALTQLLQSARP